MTEFTRIRIDLRKRKARKADISLERLHAIVARSVSVAKKDERNRIVVSTTDPNSERTLWRMDYPDKGFVAKLYISSLVAPDIAVLREEFGIDTSDYSTCSYDPFLERLETGQEWGFRLRANPTKSEFVHEHGKRGKVIALVEEKDQIEWLRKQGSRFGFHSPINRLESPEILVRSAQGIDFERQHATVTLNSVLFDGVLAIDDPDSLRTALTQGIGRAKGYGFGMLTLVPLPKPQYESRAQ